MDYKNYRVGYHPELDEIGVIVFNDDMSKYNYTKAEDDKNNDKTKDINILEK